jgi:hypothetical protein
MALNESPGTSRRRPAPLRSAFVGAVIGSKQTNSVPRGANTCAAGYPDSSSTVIVRPPPATRKADRDARPS